MHAASPYSSRKRFLPGSSFSLAIISRSDAIWSETPPPEKAPDGESSSKSSERNFFTSSSCSSSHIFHVVAIENDRKIVAARAAAAAASGLPRRAASTTAATEHERSFFFARSRATIIWRHVRFPPLELPRGLRLRGVPAPERTHNTKNAPREEYPTSSTLAR
jgi:hypothetical protein